MRKKHHIPSSIMTFVERHTDAENHEKLKKTHKDMEEKKNRLLSLMQSQQEIDVSKDESDRGTITELIEEFHKEYESLYTHYDALTEELKRKVQRTGTPKEKFSSSSDSGSDSDSASDSDHSSKGKPLNGIRSASTPDVEDLKSRLEVISNDKAALESDYVAVSNKLQDSDKIIQDLKVEAERLNQEKSDLVKENEHLKQELDAKVNELTQQMNMLRAERSRLESQMDEEKQKFSKRLSEMESDNKELKTKVKTLTDELSIRAEPKENKVGKLEKTIEGLRREADKAMEKARTFEAQLRLANQKVRVTDQLLNEDDKTHKITLQKYEERCKWLEEKIAANHQAYRKIIFNIPEKMNKLLTGMESTVKKCENEHEKFTNKLTIMSEEIRTLKHFTSEKNTIREQKDVKEMDEKITKLEVEMQKQKEEKEEMERAVSQLKKEKEEMERAVSQLKKEMEEMKAVLREKDEQISTLGEEKRQAIRQLCLWWDDAHTRYHHLKNVVSKAASETHLSR